MPGDDGIQREVRGTAGAARAGRRVGAAGDAAGRLAKP